MLEVSTTMQTYAKTGVRDFGGILEWVQAQKQQP